MVTNNNPPIPGPILSSEEEIVVSSRRKWFENKLFLATKDAPVVLTIAEVLALMTDSYIQGYGDATLKRIQRRHNEH